jgi:hypothetical protein
MEVVYTRFKEWLVESVESMQKNYNKTRKVMELLQKGELVMLNRRNIQGKHRCNKLEDKMLGQFEVLSVGSNLWCCKLRLPELWKIHPVFNIE